MKDTKVHCITLYYITKPVMEDFNMKKRLHIYCMYITVHIHVCNGVHLQGTVSVDLQQHKCLLHQGQHLLVYQRLI